jgi:hypothetical protein
MDQEPENETSLAKGSTAYWDTVHEAVLCYVYCRYSGKMLEKMVLASGEKGSR